MLRLPPHTPLFPYTTLFRSEKELPGLHVWVIAHMHDAALVRLIRPPTQLSVPPIRDERAHRERDRKSTRLNSSHLGISYAVFCLKKKNKNQQVRCNTHTHCQ